MSKDPLPRADAVTWIVGGLLYLAAATGIVWAGHAAMAGGPARQPTEYYSSFAGYKHPVRMVGQMTQEAAEELAARGGAYYIAKFDESRRLVSVVKEYDRRTRFQYAYAYDAKGAIATATITKENGEQSVIAFSR